MPISGSYYKEYNQWLSNYFSNNQKENLPNKLIQKRIFILTDGKVRNPNKVVDQAEMCNECIRTHTFGIGNGCDFKMIKETAYAGRGSYSMVTDNANQLNGLVIKALKNAFEPSLKGCKIQLGPKDNSKTNYLHEVFRNQTV